MRGTARHGTARHGTARHGTARHDAHPCRKVRLSDTHWTAYLRKISSRIYSRLQLAVPKAGTTISRCPQSCGDIVAFARRRPASCHVTTAAVPLLNRLSGSLATAGTETGDLRLKRLDAWHRRLRPRFERLSRDNAHVRAGMASYIPDTPRGRWTDAATFNDDCERKLALARHGSSRHDYVRLKYETACKAVQQWQ